MYLNDKKLKLTQNRIASMHRLGLDTVEDLLTYYPFRYEEMISRPYEQWKLKEKVTFQCEVVSPVYVWRFGGSKSGAKFDVIYDDRLLHITIFNRPWIRNVKVGAILTITGIFQGGSNITASNYYLKPINDLEKITPVYQAREGISQKTIRACIDKCLNAQIDELHDLVPSELMKKYKLLHRKDAMVMVHNPTSMNDVKLAYRTLKYEEFLKYFTAIQLMKNLHTDVIRKDQKLFSTIEVDSFIKQLPFELTKGQNEVVQEILNDILSAKPMYRLVQGDVGCGKTVVAAVALYANILAGFQSALLAPTEILARQHFEQMSNYFRNCEVSIALLYSGIGAKEKTLILKQLENGEIDLVIGTHSLIQENVQFKKLGLVVADEQQRFGVEQRKALKNKGEFVDVLLMSATPIPRTLASTLYGDMDISTIQTMPKGRKPVTTKLILENSFRSVLDDVLRLLHQGHQIYVICAAVEENPEYPVRNVNEIGRNLAKYFKDYQVGILHGQMTSEQKSTTMKEFYENQIQILVATTVVEVGMNVVNATGMIVYDADRFGLSQLHQLRGRVQRGSDPGYCWLLTNSKDQNSLERLRVLENTTDGFVISHEDLRLRGPGDILGTRQSGVPDLILGNLIEDTNMIGIAREDAKMIVQDSQNPNYFALLQAVCKQMEK